MTEPATIHQPDRVVELQTKSTHVLSGVWDGRTIPTACGKALPIEQCEPYDELIHYEAAACVGCEGAS